MSTAKIDALGLAGAVAAANSDGKGGKGISGALAGAGVGTINTISMDIQAEILNDSSITVNVGDVAVKAEDLSAIDAVAVAGTISL